MKNQIIAWLGSAFLVASGVGLYFRNHIANFIKAINVASDILNIVREGVNDAADDKLTPDEIQKITDLIVKLKGDLK